MLTSFDYFVAVVIFFSRFFSRRPIQYVFHNTSAPFAVLCSAAYHLVWFGSFLFWVLLCCREIAFFDIRSIYLCCIFRLFAWFQTICFILVLSMCITCICNLHSCLSSVFKSVLNGPHEEETKMKNKYHIAYYVDNCNFWMLKRCGKKSEILFNHVIIKYNAIIHSSCELELLLIPLHRFKFLLLFNS